ncbi:PepSY domain-containing protein [Aureivirga sp. CE67]|uniref:PepSY domain-containing protein n=1 Tax=Aureivirga sp. CE67 TaxID=1788983 RepID=UPI0018CB7477|nr:PepSY domain-containing protein [Aureivirga sp. CE67]
MKLKKAKLIRKSHRYLGLFLGVQFLFWTISGLYFSWTDIDEIHGDQFKKENVEKTSFQDLISFEDLNINNGIKSVEIIEIDQKPYYWINNKQLFNAENGKIKSGISEEEAIKVANSRIIESLEIKEVNELTEVGKHHEFRGRKLPVFAISYKGKDNVTAYVSKINGKFLGVRHDNWRVFDFLWMTHTMDFEGRDNFNTLTLRIFSLFGLFTVISGFWLWFISSPTIRRFKKNRN